MTVNRWHNNADSSLRNSCDTIDRHQARVCAMVQEVAARIGHPLYGSDLPYAAMHHDDAERELGDMPGPAKHAHPVLASAYAEAEANVLTRLGITWRITAQEGAILGLCDKLDAYLWASVHIDISADEWQGARAKVLRIANSIDARALEWVQAAMADPLAYVWADMSKAAMWRYKARGEVI